MKCEECGKVIEDFSEWHYRDKVVVVTEMFDEITWAFCSYTCAAKALISDQKKKEGKYNEYRDVIKKCPLFKSE